MKPCDRLDYDQFASQVLMGEFRPWGGIFNRDEMI